ncbi:hypothetical protein MCEMIE4_01870 [Sphingobium cupriresistens]
MSDAVKIALIAATAAIIIAGLFIYFSPYQSCMRADGKDADAHLCALHSAGGR